jgi:hypothetical protein
MKFSTEMEGMLESFASRAEAEGSRWTLKLRPPEGMQWSVMQLQCALRYFQNAEAVETLVVTRADGNGQAIHISGVPHIQQYMHHENLAVVPHQMRKVVVKASEVLPDELSARIQSELADVEETTGEGSAAFPGDKYFRFLREFQDRPKGAPVTFRARLVRESSDAAPTVLASGVLKAPFQVEFDVVCDTPRKNPNFLSQIMAHVVMYLQWITETAIPLTREQKASVLEGYDKLVKSVMSKGRPHRGGDREGPSMTFLAPKPITMEQIHVLQPGPHTYGVHTIWTGYTVTEKADGERMLLYIADNGAAYLLNNTLDVFDTGLRATTKQLCNTLLDGEYVAAEKRKDGKALDMFAIFDAYFLEGKNLMSLPLMRRGDRGDAKTRFAAMRFATEARHWEADDAHVEMRCKEHVFAEGEHMKHACKNLLRGATALPYEIDGLIFTPAELSVFGFYPGMPVPVSENMRWDRVLKWKPAEQNTIDFLVTEGAEVTDPVTKERFREYKLYTGYNAQQWEHISPLDGIRLRYDRAFADSRRDVRAYRARLFHPLSHFEQGVDTARVPVNARGTCVCEDGSALHDKVIVEFGYEPRKDVPISRRWVPLRVREDKTRIFQRTDQLSKTANDLKVATSIWRSIHAPVTMGMLTGDETVPLSAAPDTLEERLLGTDDVYYARDIPRQHMLSVHMLNFHNQGIKKMLYQRPPRKDALLELACGMAGDLPRWRDGAYRFILGVDLVKDNITNPRDGAYVRMLKQRRAVEVVTAEGMETTIYPDMVFVVGDCAKPFQTGQAAEGIDDESKKILRMLYHRDQGAASYFKYLSGRAAKGFTAASCMFAIHYFFENEAKLDGFLHNVASNLRKDGTFIATFMDGARVHALLDEAGGVVEGRKKLLDGEREVPVWAILKRYASISNEDAYGKVVEVFLENTNRLIPEYLVQLDTLVTKAKAHGLALEETQLFSHTFAQLRARVPEDPHKHSQLDKDILLLEADPIQTRFSFLNRWAVFRKM